MRRVVIAAVSAAALVLGIAGPASAHKNQVSLGITINPNPAVDGTEATITGTLTYTGTQGTGSATGHDTGSPVAGDPVANERVDIEVLTLTLDGSYAECGTADTTWVQYATGNTEADGTFAATFDTTGFAGSKICFRAHHPAEGGAHGSNQAQSLGLNLEIVSGCTSGALIAAELADGDGAPLPGSPGEWTFRITVTACEDLTNLKVQGGTSGWTQFSSAVASTGDWAFKIDQGKGKAKTSTKVLTWTIPSLDQGQTATLEVTVSGTVSNVCGTVQNINGAWSVSYKKAADSPPQPTYKSDYTSQITLEVTCPEV